MSATLLSRKRNFITLRITFDLVGSMLQAEKSILAA
jgi:hypothetical protein